MSESPQKHEELRFKDVSQSNDRVAVLAAQIKNNKQLRHIIRQAEITVRKDVYLLITKYVTFVPLSYNALMKIN